MATLYFNGAVNGDWNELGNWWEDDQFTVAASALPTSSDSVIASATISSNSGSAPTVVDFTINGSNKYLGITLTVTGIATFNDTTYNVGSITGEVEFNSSSANGQLGSIIGNVTFNDNSIHGVSANINGNATFNNSSIKRGTVSETITWNSSYPSDGSLTYYFNGAADGDWNNTNNWWLDSGFTVPVTSTLIGLPQTIDSVIASATIGSNSGSNPTIVNFTVNGNISINIDLTVSGMATFNDASTMGQIVASSKFINGNATFNNTSILLGTINGNATFNNSAICAVNSNVSTNAAFNNSSIKRGNVSGTITWNSSYPSDYSLVYYFNGAVNSNPATNGNWWLDSGCSIPLNIDIIGSPTSADSVVASAGIGDPFSPPSLSVKDFTMNGSYIGAYISLTVSGTATFDGSSFYGAGTLTGNATFNDTSFNYGNLTGQHNFIFNDYSYNQGNISWKATFNDYSYNDNTGVVDPGSNQHITTFNNNSKNKGTIYYSVIFNNNSYNIYIHTSTASGVGTIYGTAKFYDSSQNLGVINDDVEFYNNSSNITDGLGYTGIINGDVVFYNNSFNTSRINGNVIFNDDSYNAPISIQFNSSDYPYNYFYYSSPIGGQINGNATLKGRSYNKGLINGTVTEDHNRGINGSSILGLV